MKKLLLTLLGAAALCGLSPHAAAEETASANVLHMDFNKRTADHNQDLTFTGKLKLNSSSTAYYNFEQSSPSPWPAEATSIAVEGSKPTTTQVRTWTYTPAELKRSDVTPFTNSPRIIENDQIRLEFKL